MKLVLEAAREIQEFCEDNDWRFCFIGGIAVQRWAVPRNTNDVDLTLLTGIGNEEVFITRLLDRFESRIKEDALRFALTRRVVLIQSGDVGIDISLGALEFEELAVKRSTYFSFTPETILKTCSAEDLIVFKAFANRLKDWADIESILRLQRDLDWSYVDSQLKPLVDLKEEPEITGQLEKLRKLSENEPNLH